MASPQLQNIIQMLKSSPIREDASFEETRAGFEQIADVFPVAADVKREKVNADGVPCEWITPPGVSGATTVMYIHGGGWTIGSLNTHARLVSLIAAAADARALSVDYRLAPEHPFPAAPDDCLTLYRWLLDQGVRPEQLIIAGDSAGGNLTLVTLLRVRDEALPLPAAAVALSPATDMEMTGESFTSRRGADPMIDPDGMPRVRGAYCPGEDLRNPLISPLYGDLSGLPPLLIHVGDAEVLLDDSRQVAERAKEAGVDVTLEVWDEMIHVFQFFAPILPEATEAIARIGEFVKSHVGSPVRAS
jgi:acetyl esterase/lipase